jgi:hypothetical protein
VEQWFEYSFSPSHWPFFQPFRAHRTRSRGFLFKWATVGRKNNPPFGNSVNIQSPTLSNPAGGPGRIFPPNVDTLDIFNKEPSVQSWSFSLD